MSMSGAMRAKLEAERREKIRLDQVRATCRALKQALATKIEEIGGKDSHSIRHELSTLATELAEIVKIQVSVDPDKALIKIQSYQEKIVKTLIAGKKGANEWTDFQQELRELKLNTEVEVNSLQSMEFKLAKAKYAELKTRFDALDQGTTTKESLENIIKEVLKTRKEIEEEEVRRETVKSIILMFKELGFKASKPKLSGNGVSLTGNLPSGKKAFFTVDLDGSIAFNFEGYIGTGCKDQLEAIQEELEKNCNLKTEIEQYEWHNPDLIEKGSKDFPIGGQTRSRTA